jgi:predicted RNase H-like nuclease
VTRLVECDAHADPNRPDGETVFHLTERVLSMSKAIGLDWASNGWFGVILTDGGAWETDLFPSIWSVWKYHSDATQILVDIPIGLPSDAKRACDVRAKEKLGRRQHSVFYTPIREAVYEQNIEEAKETHEEAADFSIQNQAWSLVPRIREVDEFLDMYPSARDRLHETHPELCFYALNGRTPLTAGKKTEEGRRQRKALLADEHPDAMTIYEESVGRYTTPSYAPMVSGPDDILDALVAAVTAQRSSSECLTLPEAPPTDARGLPMQIVYPSDTEQTRLSTLESHD